MCILQFIKYNYPQVRGGGIKTTVYRNIRVYTNATLAYNDTESENGIYMEQGAYTTTEAQVQYLKKFINARDPEKSDSDPIGDLIDRVTVDCSEIKAQEPGEYNIKYSVINDYGKKMELTGKVIVIRTINVSVPTTVPFQVVTNLINKDADPFVSGILNLTNNRTSDVNVFLESFTREGDSGDLQLVAPDSENWDNLSEAESMSKMALGVYIKSGFKEETNNNPDNETQQPDDDTVIPDNSGDQNSGSGESAPDSDIPQTPNTDLQSGETGGNSDLDEGADGNNSNLRKVSDVGNESLKDSDVTWLIPNTIQHKKIGVLLRATSLTEPSIGRLSFTSKHGKNFIGGTSKGTFRLVFKFE